MARGVPFVKHGEDGSYYGLPLTREKRLIGVLALLAPRDRERMERAYLKGLRLLQDLFTYAVSRRIADVELEQAIREIEGLKKQLEVENLHLRHELSRRHAPGEIIAESTPMQEVLMLVEKVASTNSVVLVEGETGTGKELISRKIHSLSGRRGRPMVTVNCAALSPTLIESELFGREKGAYTGALTRAAGRFEVADRSTLFLDEIGELPKDLQTKLLRVLQDNRFERIGSTRTIEVDVRLIAATNRDLRSAVEAGEFREDLYYRLSVFPISVPPLRDRQKDIPMLVWTFVEEFGPAMKRVIERIPQRTMDSLLAYPWPGNVRELRNLIERAMIVGKGPVLEVDVPIEIASTQQVERTLDEVQRDHILATLVGAEWRIRGPGGAAERLGLRPTTLESRIKKLSIHRPAAVERSET